jgi:hypothetical protein
VRQRGTRYQIAAGERRYQAAVQVGVRDVPVVIRELDDTEVIEVALVENLQRKDLTPFEESEALQALAERCGYTHEDLARRVGKSRTAITESLSLMDMPEEVRNLCRLADISSKSLLLQIVRQGDSEMIALVEGRPRAHHAAAGPRGHAKAETWLAEVLRVCLPSETKAHLRLSFKNLAWTDEITALEAIIASLERQALAD